MTIDKSKVYSAVNAGDLKLSRIYWVADTMKDLQDSPVRALVAEISEDGEFVDSTSETWKLAYPTNPGSAALVKELREKIRLGEIDIVDDVLDGLSSDFQDEVIVWAKERILDSMSLNEFIGRARISDGDVREFVKEYMENSL